MIPFVLFMSLKRLLDRCNSRAVQAVLKKKKKKKKTENQTTIIWPNKWNNQSLIVLYDI